MFLFLTCNVYLFDSLFVMMMLPVRGMALVRGRAKSNELIGRIMEQVLSFIFLCLTGVACYWFFFKCIGWFEKI